VRITLTSALPTAARDADLLSEAIPEDPDLKGHVLAEFNAACPPRTIFTTNTSTWLPCLAHASDALEVHLPIQFGSARPENLTSQDHISQPLAS